jgi:hypothetical protein
MTDLDEIWFTYIIGLRVLLCVSATLLNGPFEPLPVSFECLDIFSYKTTIYEY